jgi:hypothetical protein
MPSRRSAESHGRKIRNTLRTPARRQVQASASTTGLLGPGQDTPDRAGAIGTPGNLNISGFLTGEDYNPDLDGFSAYKIYDQMRRGDAQVNATLLMCKLPIKGAKVAIVPASEDPQDIAIADFVSAALLDDDAMAISWSDVLDNALLKLDFGSSCHEKIVMVDEHGAIRYRKLAPRLPKTFYRWIEDEETGTLKVLQQFAPKAGRFGFYDLPVERLVLHVLNREGQNWYGRSILRPAYPNYYWKQQLYRIDAVGHDRFHVGIPIAKLTKDYQASSAPLDKIEQTLQGLRSYEFAYLVQPFGVEYDILMPKGSASATGDIMASVEHHNTMIARNILQQFTAAGSQAHGSNASSRVSLDAFYDALVGILNEITAEFRPVVRQLCDWNFTMAGRDYPALQFTDLGSQDATAVADGLSKLASAGLINWDAKLETWLRQLWDAPERDAIMPVPPDGAPETPGADTPPEAAAAGAIAAPAPPTAPIAAAKGYEEAGRRFARVPTTLERKILNLHEIPSTLDDAKARLARQLGDLRLEALRKIAATIAKKDARPTAAFTDLRRIHLPKANATPLIQAIRAIQTRMVAYGRQQVRAELHKQGVVLEHQLADEVAKASDGVATAQSALVSSARATGERLADTWQSLALENAIRLRRSGLVGEALTARLIEELEDQAESGASRDAASEVNEAFGIGRDLEAAAHADVIESVEYSAVLDGNTCDACAELDGTQYASEDDAPDVPNPDCEGRDACRCVLLFLTQTAAA